MLSTIILDGGWEILFYCICIWVVIDTVLFLFAYIYKLLNKDEVQQTIDSRAFASAKRYRHEHEQLIRQICRYGIKDKQYLDAIEDAYYSGWANGYEFSKKQ